MRSEERAGIVFAVLLFLWGTIVTEPLHIFTNMLYSAAVKIFGLFHVTFGTVSFSVLFMLGLTGFVVLLLVLSKYKFADYYPVFFIGITTVYYIIAAVKNNSFETHCIVTLSVLLFLLAVIYLLKLEVVIPWFSDICALSPAVYLLTGILFIPLRIILGDKGKFLYITNRQDINISAPFNKLFNLPVMVWGVFFTILLFLPIVYFSFFRNRESR